ncbi:hypothetical protein ECANGB1_136 [Enterospora canceri]|uniref:Uncharacterized protein n=1 Tax=Enterospora canceri TaxID=1081671 RepID=A0A1Y1S896_9MICR|nr:hypothetical protein ECANGB1_136 [Enterospora canceri]
MTEIGAVIHIGSKYHRMLYEADGIGFVFKLNEDEETCRIRLNGRVYEMDVVEYQDVAEFTRRSAKSTVVLIHGRDAFTRDMSRKMDKAFKIGRMVEVERLEKVVEESRVAWNGAVIGKCLTGLHFENGVELVEMLEQVVASYSSPIPFVRKQERCGSGKELLAAYICDRAGVSLEVASVVADFYKTIGMFLTRAGVDEVSGLAVPGRRGTLGQKVAAEICRGVVSANREESKCD